MSNNNFTFLLIVVCVALIATLILINRIQERRTQTRLEREKSEHLASVAAQATLQMPVETTLDVPYEAPESERDVDELTEAVIDVRFGHRVLGSDLIPVIKKHLKLKTKPVRFLGISPDHQPCAPLHITQEYESLQIVVTLANSYGPLNQEEWSRLYSLADQLAADFDGEVEHASLDDLKIKAQQADKIYRTHLDNVTLFWIMAMPLPFATLDKVLRQHGFENGGTREEPQAIWFRKNSYGTDYQMCRVLEWSQQNEVTQVVFEQRLALTLETSQPFTDLMNSQRELMAPLNMQIVDEEGQPILPEMDALVDEELQAFYQEMRSEGLWPGSFRMSRLFS